MGQSPDSGPGRRLVLLFDGTWNRREHTTNVWRTKLLLEQSDRQLVYYDQGVGTDPEDKIQGGALGKGLSSKVLAGYLWLMENYRESRADEVFIFGFSRGAFTARSLTGLLSLCGLLRRDAAVSVSRAFNLSRVEGLKRWHRVTKRFRESYSRELRVKFLGVWDTVGALGVPKLPLPFSEKYRFHKAEMQEIVDHARQALALDEHRKLFAPSIWPKTVRSGQTLEQRWFTGSHSNVGGGYARDGLFLRPLQWMIHEAAACGLVFRSKLLQLDDRFYASLPRDSLGETGLGSYYLTQFFRRFDRTVTLGDDSKQTVDYTVLERWLWDPTYENPSLVGILGSKPERRSRSFRLDDREIESELGSVLAASPTRGFACPRIRMLSLRSDHDENEET